MVIAIAMPLVLAGSLAGCGGSSRPPALKEPVPAVPVNGIALVNGVVIDGTGHAPIRSGVVVIKGTHIAAVGAGGAVRIPAGARIIDVHGATILPGLVNAHVHDAYSESNLYRWAVSGVTTVRDLGVALDRLGVSLAFARRAALDPRLARVVPAGAPLTVPGGYLADYGAAVSSTAQVRAMVDKQAGLGVRAVKIVVRSRAGQGLEGSLACAAVREAHLHGLRVTADVSVSADVGVVLGCGVDDLAHMVSDELPAQLIVRLVRVGVIIEPTLTNHERAGDRRVVLGNLRRFVQAGGLVALGSEYIGSVQPSGPFAGMPTAELEMMTQAGMSPMQVIVAATQTAAQAVGLGRDAGSLRVGKLADILVVRGDPLRDVRTLGKAELVVHNGVLITPPDALTTVSP